MTLFSTLTRRNTTSSDEKDHNSDNDDNTNEIVQLTPLLLDSPSSNTNNNNNSNSTINSDSFTLRIKLNNGSTTIDYTLDNISQLISVSKLEDAILTKHFSSTSSSTNKNTNNRYLRLIIRGRMMAPDTSTLSKFNIVTNDVIHAVLAKENVKGGQQARMLRRMNGIASPSSSVVANSSNISVAPNAANTTSNNNNGRQSLWRRIGIDSNGVVLSRPTDNDDDSDEFESTSEGGSDFEDAHGEIDLEANNQPQRRGRRRRERRGFDRLRATGMTRDEVTAIRLYFARSVDRYIERRRVMIIASQRLRNSLTEIDGNTTDTITPSSPTRTGSTNSLLDTATESEESNDNAGSGENNDTTTAVSAADNSNSNNGGENAVTTATESNQPGTATTPGEGEEILNDRLRMEDEWMSTQGPYSEFRMNLNTSNPLLLAAVSGGGATGVLPGSTMPTTTPGGGLFFRNRPSPPSLEDDEEMLGGTFTSTGTFIRNGGAANGSFHPFLGPLPSAGTDKDFIWGFILGFFVGFIMLFWVWMPTVPHKQKVGIIVGISFQLGVNLLRKGV